MLTMSNRFIHPSVPGEMIENNDTGKLLVIKHYISNDTVNEKGMLFSHVHPCTSVMHMLQLFPQGILFTALPGNPQQCCPTSPTGCLWKASVGDIPCLYLLVNWMHLSSCSLFLAPVIYIGYIYGPPYNTICITCNLSHFVRSDKDSHCS